MTRLFFLLLFLFFTVAGLAQAMPRIVINEILFNPKPGGSDYIELYNGSDSVVDLQTLFLTNQNSSGTYGVLKKLSDTTRYLLPKNYVVFTEDASGLAQYYFVKTPDAVVELSSLPSYPNTEGTVVLLDSANNERDAVHYSDAWEVELLADGEGVALERIDPAGASNEKSNWRSAASDAGYGTPGYQNSQYKLFQNPMAAITISPNVFSPDGDGVDDAAMIEYHLTDGGVVANIFIYDVSGRQVRHVAKNAVLGTSGKFRWDGLDEKGQQLPIGQYIIYTELFTLQGKKQQFKNVVVLARRLN